MKILLHFPLLAHMFCRDRDITMFVLFWL